MNKRLGQMGVVLLICALTGCIEFEEQTMSYRYDTATDTLFIFQDYQGIFGGNDTNMLAENEVDQLASVMKGDRTFFFGNWITEYDRKKLEETLQKPDEELQADSTKVALARNAIQTALDNVKVENIGFYFNKENRLCGAQQVTVKNASKVLAGLNKVLSLVITEEAAKTDKPEDEKQRLLKFANSGRQVLRLDGNRLDLHWPVSQKDFLEFRDQSPQAEAFRQSGGKIRREGSLVILTIGQTKTNMVSWNMPVSDIPYSDNGFSEALKYGIKQDFDPVSAARAFLLGDNPK